MASYRELIRSLAGIDAEVDAHRAEAHDWYARTVGNAEAKHRQARSRVVESRQRLRNANRQADDIDARVYVLWEDFRPYAGRIGNTRPTAILPPEDDHRSAGEWLGEAEQQLSRSGRRPELSDQTRRIMVMFGVLGGLLAGLAGFGVRAAGRSVGGDLAVVLPVLALLLTLALGPIVALLAAKVYADRRGAVLEAGAVSVLIISSLITAGLAIVVQNVQW
jgi:hypothetical protein